MRFILFQKEFWRSLIKGKSTLRCLSDLHLKTSLESLHGTIIDVGGGGGGKDYYRYFPPDAKVICTDINENCRPEQILDLNKPLPFPDNSIDAVVAYNVLYIVEDIEWTMREIHRVLRREGVLVWSMPFIFNESREPHDYIRLTSEGIERVVQRAGFLKYSLVPVGGRASAALSLLCIGRIFKYMNIFLLPLAVIFDGLLPYRIRRTHPAPLIYIVTCYK